MPRSETETRSIEFIFFDLGNVLLDFSHQRACEQIARISNLPFDNVWQTIFETHLAAKYELGQVTDDQFHAGFCAATGSTVQRQPFLLAFSDIFCLNESVFALAVELSQQCFPIGILSNTCSAHWKFAVERFPELGHYFSTSVLSFEEGSAKPDRKIFEVAVDRAKAKPENIFFVDDRVDNVLGACAVGIDAVVFESAQQFRRELRHRGLVVQ